MAFRCALALVLCAGCFFKPDPPSGTGSDGDGGLDANVGNYARRRRITITRTLAQDFTETLQNFPVSVVLPTDTDLAANSSGDDILFTAQDGVTPLEFEVVDFGPTVGRLEAWVKVPSLPVETTSIYLYYDGPTVAHDPAKVWSDAFAVWHMNNVGQEPDSSQNVQDLQGVVTRIPGVTPGIVGGARNYDGDDFLCVGQDDVLPLGANAFSVSAWVQASSTNLFDAPFWRGGEGTSPGITFELGQSPWQVIVRDNGNNGTLLDLGQETTAWAFLGFSANNPGGSFESFRDGRSAGTGTASGFGALPSVTKFCLGRSDTSTYHGALDEVRVWRKAQPEEWYLTEYDNVMSRNSFMTVGSVEVQ